ncbi:MAG: hypothetical protein ACYTDY_05915 [Planctomycetota bacterium]|jgi:hypothetical protein
MAIEREFDCVAMKDRIQAEILEERERLGEDEQLEQHREWLERSDEPLARWWREVSRRASAAGPSSAG